MRSGLTAMLRVGIACWALLAVAGADLAHASYVNFETVAARPLALSPDGDSLFAVNTPDGRLEIFDVSGDGLLLRASLPVGLEPVAVAARSNDEVWVVNHLSDSISVVDVASTPPRLVRTLLVGDEPWDIVFAGLADPNTGDFSRAFISAARRGQNHPADVKSEAITPGVGRADVWVFDADDPGADFGGTPEAIVQLFGDKPRALSASPDGSSLYAGVFHSGNLTTAINETGVCDGFGGLASSFCVVGFGSDPDPIVAPGGLPEPSQDSDMPPNPAPEVGLIVQFDEPNGFWKDELGRDWSDLVPFSLPDNDVFEIDALTLSATPTRVFNGVGTVLFALAMHPSGRVYVANTEARNEVRFEGPGTASTTVRGHLHEARVTVLGGTPAVVPRHLNKHLDYAAVTVPAGDKQDSLATPVGLAFSGDGSTLWVAAFGSAAIGVFATTELDDGSFVPDAADHIPLSGGGPSGLAVDPVRDRLYVLTRFDNAVKTIDTLANVEIASLSLHTSEPIAVRAGRDLLYDSIFTSSNGEASCSACHVFGNLDGLAWDLGNPDNVEADNPNPFVKDPVLQNPSAVFHPMKGPMTSQTLRGLDHHGPMHWRGDRTGATPADPNQAFDEQAAFEAFNVAFDGLLGREGGPIPSPDMTQFARFALTILPPPNPYRALDGSLTTSEASGRSRFLNDTLDGGHTCEFCHELDPAQGLFGTGGRMSVEGETQEFKVPHLRNLYDKVGMFGTTVGLVQPGALGPQVRGFGFLHNGSVGSVFDFLSAPVFAFNNDNQRREVEEFMLAFDSNLAPIVGQQVTLTPSSPAPAGARIDLMRQRAVASFDTPDFPGARECELVVRGAIAGEPRGWVLDPNSPSGDYEADLGPPISDADLRSLAGTPGQELTFTCVYPTGGQRIGLDRDEDGIVDAKQCGDVNGDGLVTPDDSILTRLELAGARPLAHPAKCNVIGSPGAAPSLCTIRDATLQALHAAGLGPELLQICGPAL